MGDLRTPLLPRDVHGLVLCTVIDLLAVAVQHRRPQHHPAHLRRNLEDGCGGGEKVGGGGAEKIPARRETVRRERERGETKRIEER